MIRPSPDLYPDFMSQIGNEPALEALFADGLILTDHFGYSRKGRDMLRPSVKRLRKTASASHPKSGKPQLPKDEVRKLVLEWVEKAAPDGRLLAFEVSEDVPLNWKESMPVVLGHSGKPTSDLRCGWYGSGRST